MQLFAAEARCTDAQQAHRQQAATALASECADLRIELARRDAEIESLQGALAVAAACQRDAEEDSHSGTQLLLEGPEGYSTGHVSSANTPSTCSTKCQNASRDSNLDPVLQCITDTNRHADPTQRVHNKIIGMRSSTLAGHGKPLFRLRFFTACLTLDINNLLQMCLCVYADWHS